MSYADQTSYADFQQSRDEVLTRRLRSAKASGNVPQWQVVGIATVEAPPPPTSAPPVQDPTSGGAPAAATKEDGDSDPSSAPQPPIMARWALAAGIVALLVILVSVALMLAHRAKYRA